MKVTITLWKKEKNMDYRLIEIECIRITSKKELVKHDKSIFIDHLLMETHEYLHGEMFEKEQFVR